MNKRKKEASSNEFQVETRTIKCALKNRCLNEKVYEKIQKDVEELSNLFIELTLYIKDVLTRQFNNNQYLDQPINALDFIYELMHDSLAKYVIDQHYVDRRANYNMPAHSKKYRGNTIVFMATQYETGFHNNLWMHARSRLKKFFMFFEEDKDIINTTLNAILYRNSDDVPDEVLIGHMILFLDYDEENLYDIEDKRYYFKYVKLFYQLQRFNDENNLKNFAIFPIGKHGRHHVRYDSNAFMYLLASIGLGTTVKNQFDKTIKWPEYFDYRKLETGKKKFDYSITTDGVAVSFTMSVETRKPMTTETAKKKRKKEIQKENKDANFERIKRKLNCYEQHIGLDPGLKLLVGGIRYDVDGNKNEFIDFFFD